MEFLDNTGHVFSLKSYNEKPIGYEYEETPYIFWMDSNTSRLSINNYYSRPIYALYFLDKDYSIDELKNENSPIQISIEIENSNVYKLIDSLKFNEYILSNDYNDLNDYIDLGNIDEHSDYLKTSLTNENLFVIKTNEKINNNEKLKAVDFNYLLIPIYPIACANEEGTWITNIMIHIYDETLDKHEWCPISIGGEFINEFEELVINGKNIGLNLPKDILKAVYSESLYNDEFNEALFNEKLKEYLINKTIIKHECGNFNSVIASLKWFGYGDKLSIAKLLKTDNNSKNQYLLDYFNIKNDIIEAFKLFKSNALVSLKLMINRETDEQYPFDFTKDFYGENKPKMLSLLDHYEKIKIGNHDMPIENDDEKYWYWKPYFDFSFTELGIKLACLKQFYKQYFLPLHLYIHNASLGYRVFANDIKYTVTTGISMNEPLVSLNIKENEVEFKKDNTYYFTKQIHYIDDNFNEFNISNVDEDPREWFELNDTCVSIPIKFINNDNNKGYFNCTFILMNENISNQPLLEKRFAFCQDESYQYKNFIIYPKKLNIRINEYDVTSNYFEYWINDDFKLKVLVNNRWYEYTFNLKIHNPTIDFGTLRYRYYLNDHNYLLSMINNNDVDIHSFIFTNQLNINNDTYSIDPLVSLNNITDINNYIYRLFNLDGSQSFVRTLDISNIDDIWQYFESNYNLLSPFTQLSRLDDNNQRVSFNAYMHNVELVNTNNINFDIDFYLILKYHLDHNLMYIDGTLLNREFYQFILYPYKGRDVEILIHKDMIGMDIEIPTNYFNNDKIVVCSWLGTMYILNEAGVNTNSYFINTLYDNIIFVSEGDKNTSEEEDHGSYDLLLDSLSLKYDSINKTYYSYKIVINNGEPIEEKTGIYPIYDKLYCNTDYIYSKYNSEINLPNLDKYKNSLHLFNIYTQEETENNILIFHNNIDLYINGLRFQYKSYLDIENNDAAKIYISGKPSANEFDTRFPDVYGLHLIEHIEDIPKEITNNILQCGLYVKRDYKHYYEPKETIYYTELDHEVIIGLKQVGDVKEPGIEYIDKIYELENIYDYDTKEFSYYIENKDTLLGSLYFKTLEDFYNDNRFNEEFNEPVKVFKENDQYYFYDLETKDLFNLSKYYKNEVSYKIKFIDNDSNEIDVSLNDIYNISYNKIKIELYYHKHHIVRNRFYLLSEYIEEYQDRCRFEYIDETHIKLIDENNEEHIIELIKYNIYQYIDQHDNHLISNQNPSYYWLNIDNNSIETLPSYLNELERYAYDAKDTSLEDILEKLDTYKLKFENHNYDDSKEVLYNYVSYLSKDFTGESGKFRFDLTVDNNFNNGDVKLLVNVINENGNLITYDSNEVQTFVLNGNERNVILYIQLNINALNNIDTWIIPRLYKVRLIDKQLEYKYEECGEEHVITKILNKEYYYGDNKHVNVYNLYNDFFDLKFNIYDSYIKDNEANISLLNSVYDVKDELKLNAYLDYDFYLMHDDQYWYGIYISRQTCNLVQKYSDLQIPDENKEMILNVNHDTDNVTYKLKHVKSSKEYLINRFEFISSNGYNHFKDDDIIACYINNNDRLSFNPYISSKWSISPMSLGMSVESKFESNGEMTILSMPKNDNKYQKGYYKVTVKYSLDRDIQHQFKNTSTLMVS